MSNDLKYDAERDLRDIGAGKIEVFALNKVLLSQNVGVQNILIQNALIQKYAKNRETLRFRCSIPVYSRIFTNSPLIFLFFPFP